MTKNILIGIVLVVLVVSGGWWYLNQPNAPTTSQTQQAGDTETQPVANNQQSQSNSNPTTNDTTTPHATLASHSISVPTGVFTITGTEKNLKDVGIYLVPSTYDGNRDEVSVRQFLVDQKLYNVNASASSGVTNGEWSVTFGTFKSAENGQPVTKPVAAGTYTVLVYNSYDPDPTKSTLLLDTGTLTIGE